MYKESLVRMSEGNFFLNYNTNDESLQELIKAEGNLVQHGANTEKVLGYIYSPEKDNISVNSEEAYRIYIYRSDKSTKLSG